MTAEELIKELSLSPPDTIVQLESKIPGMPNKDINIIMHWDSENLITLASND